MQNKLNKFFSKNKNTHLVAFSGLERVYNKFKFNLSVFRKFNEYGIVLKNKIERISGYRFSEISNAFSSATVGLIFIKLIFRLNEINPNWQFNVFVLFFFTFLSIYFNLYSYIMLYIKNLWRKGLGKDFYYRYYQEKRDHPLTFFGVHIPYLFKNSWKLNVYIYLIYFRLFLLTEPYLFLIFNFFVIYFLIVNKYFLIASLINIILVFSKLTLLVESKTFSKFFNDIQLLIKLENNETIKPTWDNACLVGIFNTRYFDENLDLQTDERKENNNKSELSGYIAERIFPMSVYMVKKIKEIEYVRKKREITYEEYTINENYLINYMTLEHRQFWSIPRLQQQIDQIILKKEKNKILKILIICIIFIFSFKYSVNNEFNLCFHHFIYSPVKSALRNYVIQLESKLLKKGQESDNVIKEMTNQNNIHMFPGSQGHPSIVIIDPGNETLYHIIKTHIREGNTPHLPKLDLENRLDGVSKGVSQLMQQHKIEQYSNKLANYPSAFDEIVKLFKNKENFLIHLEINMREAYKKHLNEESFDKFFDYLNPRSEANLRNSELIQHKSLSVTKFLILDPTASLDNVKKMIMARYEYFQTRFLYDNEDQDIAVELNKTEFFLTYILPLIDQYKHLYSGENHAVYEQEIALINSLTYNLKYNLNNNGEIKDPLEIEFAILQLCKNKTFEEIKKEFTNSHTMKQPFNTPQIKSESVSMSHFSHTVKNLDSAFAYSNKQLKQKLNETDILSNIKKDRNKDNGSDLE